MQLLLFVLFQLDEARRYIEDGRLPHLRLALLLLDNAVEIQMDQNNWERDAIKERLRELSIKVSPEHLTEYMREVTAWTPLTPSEPVRRATGSPCIHR